MLIARVVAGSVAVAGLLSASCAGSASAPSAPATGSSPGATTSTSTASGTSGESLAGVLARTVTGVDPILLPTAIPAGWAANIDATSDDLR